MTTGRGRCAGRSRAVRPRGRVTAGALVGALARLAAAAASADAYYQRPGTTERVSVGSDGTQGDSGSFSPAISADGRHVAFQSDASNLVPGDTNATRDVFVRDRGLATGVGALEVHKAPGELILSGWATFAGAAVAWADDPPDDGVDATGGEITGVSVIYRPEQEDLLLRMDLASLPGRALGICLPIVPCVGANTGAGVPGILYRWSFTAGEAAYEVRALRAAATSTPPGAPYFALYECTLDCTEEAPLTGGIGTTGAEVRVSVPLHVLGAGEGIVLTDLDASTALGEATPGSLVVLDEVELPDASIPVPGVELGIAPASVPEASVPFSSQADLVEGRFSGTVDVWSLAAGEYRVWARACLDEACGTSSVEVSL